MNIYEKNQYYTALEVSKLLSLGKDAILQRCRKGYYEGAYKTLSSQSNHSHGEWLIPKHLIDTPYVIQKVANLTRQINPIELEQTITNVITHVITLVIEPLNQKINKQAIEIIKQAELIQQLQVNFIQKSDKIIGELNKINNEESESLEWWWIVVISIIIIAGGVLFLVSKSIF
jgi:hypothetical protein